MEEAWVDINGYEGYYQVSNLGRVRSMDRTIAQKNGSCRTVKGKLLSLLKHEFGYHRVRLSRVCTAKNKEVHALVLTAFKGERPFAGAVALHLDSNPANNNVNNLKWGTQSENIKQSFDEGRSVAVTFWKGKFGSLHNRSKLFRKENCV